MDIDSHSTEVNKDKEIADLKALVEELNKQLQLEKVSRENKDSPPEIYAKVKIREAFEMKGVKDDANPTPKHQKTLPFIGKSRAKPRNPSNNSISSCKHRDMEEIVVEQMPQYQYRCDQCGKGFTHKNKLLQHKEEHIAPTDSMGKPKKTAPNQSKEIHQDNDKVYKHKKLKFQFNFSDIYSCDQCEKVFDSKNKQKEHEVEHRTAQEEVNVPEEQASFACTCRYPCVPIVVSKNGRSNRSVHIPQVLGDSGEDPRQIAGGQQDIRQVAGGQQETWPEAGGQQENSQVAGGPQEAWQVAGGPGRFKCNICGKTRNTRSKMERHMSDHEEDLEDGSSTCSKCSYQTTNRDDLVKHIYKAHGIIEATPKYGQQTKDTSDRLRFENHGFRCNICSIHLTSKIELNNHKNEAHKTYRPCNKYPYKKCEYDSECHFVHTILKENEHMCYKCGDIVKTKTGLYNHIKQNHGHIPCYKFQQNCCDYSSQDCLYKHIMNNHTQRVHNVAPRVINEDFQNTGQPRAPPEWPTIGARTKTMSPNEEILKRMIMLEESLRDLKKLVIQN